LFTKRHSPPGSNNANNKAINPKPIRYLVTRLLVAPETAVVGFGANRRDEIGAKGGWMQFYIFDLAVLYFAFRQMTPFYAIRDY